MNRQTDKHLHHKQFWTPHYQIITASRRVGRSAENLVIFYLKNRGWRILARNYETSRGEVDIIAYKMHADLKGYPTVVFVEVKSRSNAQGLSPELNVTAAKQRKLSATIRQWIGAHARLRAVYRCDIAALIVPRKKIPRIRYFPNAYCMREPVGW